VTSRPDGTGCGSFSLLGLFGVGPLYISLIEDPPGEGRTGV
jgi:hypothetical protein